MLTYNIQSTFFAKAQRDLRKPTRDITVNIFPQVYFNFRKVFFLFPQGFF